MFYKLVEESQIYCNGDWISNRIDTTFVEADSQKEVVDRYYSDYLQNISLSNDKEKCRQEMFVNGHWVNFYYDSDGYDIAIDIKEISQTDYTLCIYNGEVVDLGYNCTYAACIKMEIHNFELDNDFETYANILLRCKSFDEAYVLIKKEVDNPQELLLLADKDSCRTDNNEVGISNLKIVFIKDLGEVHVLPKKREELPKKWTPSVKYDEPPF